MGAGAARLQHDSAHAQQARSSAAKFVVHGPISKVLQQSLFPALRPSRFGRGQETVFLLQIAAPSYQYDADIVKCEDRVSSRLTIRFCVLGECGRIETSILLSN